MGKLLDRMDRRHTEVEEEDESNSILVTGTQENLINVLKEVFARNVRPQFSSVSSCHGKGRFLKETRFHSGNSVVVTMMTRSISFLEY